MSKELLKRINMELEGIDYTVDIYPHRVEFTPESSNYTYTVKKCGCVSITTWNKPLVEWLTSCGNCKRQLVPMGKCLADRIVSMQEWSKQWINKN